MHNNPKVNALMKRGYLYLEDHEWKNAKGYFDDSLDIDPENANAYIGMLLAEMHIERECELYKSEQSFIDNYYYKKALRFADEDYQKKLHECYLDNIYYQAEKLFENAATEEDYKNASECFSIIPNYKDSEERVKICLEFAEKTRIESLYASAVSLMNSTLVSEIEEAKKKLEIIKDYKDSAELLIKCDDIVISVKKTNERERKKKIIIINAFAAIVLSIIFIVLGGITSVNIKRADIIYQNFLGESFVGEFKDDHGFAQAALNDSLNNYRTYWLETEKRTVAFRNDGSVYYTAKTDMTALAYPSSISKPDGYHNEYDGTFSSFDVRVELNGDVYVEIGASSYLVTVDENNVPKKIHDYHGMTLD